MLKNQLGENNLLSRTLHHNLANTMPTAMEVLQQFQYKLESFFLNEFPQFDFSDLDKYWWNNNIPTSEKKIVKENFNDIKIRLDKFKKWLDNNDSTTIALVSHGTFLSQITGYMLENCEHIIWEY